MHPLVSWTETDSNRCLSRPDFAGQIAPQLGFLDGIESCFNYHDLVGIEDYMTDIGGEYDKLTIRLAL